MIKIGVIKLNSLLSGGDKALEEEAKAFLDEINKDGDFEFADPIPGGPNFYLIQTGGSEEFFVKNLPNSKPPYIIVPQGMRNSIAASLEIMSYMNQRGLKGELILDDVASRLKSLFGEQEKSVPISSYAIIGEPSPWLIASQVDEQEALQRLGVRLVSLPLDELYKAIDRQGNKKYREDELEALTGNKNQLAKNYQLYYALKELLEANHLDGFTLRCFDLIQARAITSCLPYGLLMDEGYLCGCEGDVPSLLTMHLFKLILGKATFMANPERFDFENNMALFAHCTCPTSMCSSYRLDTHFESGLDFGIRGEMPLGKVTAAKLSSDLRRLRIMKGEVVPHEFEDGICRTQIMVKFEDGLHDLFDNPFGNHLIFAYGEYSEQLEELARKYDLKTN